MADLLVIFGTNNRGEGPLYRTYPEILAGYVSQT